METERNTAPSLLSVLEELKQLELIIHRPELATTHAELAQMTAPEFWETGASGRRYSREYVLDVLEQRRSAPPPEAWHTSDFYCQQLAENLFLLTYTLLQGERLTRRSTIWRRVNDALQIVYHQGTVVQE